LNIIYDTMDAPLPDCWINNAQGTKSQVTSHNNDQVTTTM